MPVHVVVVPGDIGFHAQYVADRVLGRLGEGMEDGLRPGATAGAGSIGAMTLTSCA